MMTTNKKKKKINLHGRKPCIHKKTFYGMIVGRCIKCGGWLSEFGMNKVARKNFVRAVRVAFGEQTLGEQNSMVKAKLKS